MSDKPTDPRMLYPARYKWSDKKYDSRDVGAFSWRMVAYYRSEYRDALARYKAGDHNWHSYSCSERNAIMMLFAGTGAFDGGEHRVIFKGEKK